MSPHISTKKSFCKYLKQTGGFENHVSGKGMIADQLLDSEDSQVSVVAEGELVLEGSLNGYYWQFYICTEDEQQPTIQAVHQERQEELLHEDVAYREAEAGQHAAAIEHIGVIEQVPVVGA